MACESLAIVEAADRHNIDYKILVGIAGAESGFERAGDIYDFNPYGVGCQDSGTCRGFKSFAESTEFLAKTLDTHPAYTLFRQTGDLYDLANRYLTGNKERWVGNVKTYIIQQTEKKE